MSEFTKGKWTAFYGEDFHGIRAAHADDEQGHDYGNGQIIAHVVRWNDGHSWANARLIAAAPEMYEELIFAITALRGGDAYDRKRADKIEALLDRIDGKED